ncbi:MAG: flippase [Pseudomonadota bacterium]
MSAPQAQSLKSILIRGALGTAGLGVFQRVLSLVTAILLARILGAEDYGYFTFAITVVGLLAVLAQLGLPQLATREIAALQTLERWSLLNGLRRRSLQLMLLSLSVVILLGVLLRAFSAHIPAMEPTVFLIALVMLPLMIMAEIFSGFLKGLHRVVHATWPLAAFKPLLTLAIVVSIFVFFDEELRANEAILATLIGTAAALIALLVLLRRFWPAASRDLPPEFDSSSWARALLPFTLLGAANLIIQKTDIILLGVLGSPEDVGIYHIAVQGAMLVSFGFAAINAVLAPNIARLHVTGDRRQLQRLMTVSTRAILAIAVGVLLVLVVFGQFILDRVFGDEFVRGYPALVVLGVGQLINASAGSVGTFLSMTRHERDTARAILAGTGVNTVLNLILIPAFGLIGAAAATALSTVVWNIMMSYSVYHRLDIMPGPIDWRK